MNLKSIDQQVIVITGASSGIGLATAETAAEGGAKLVLAARSAQTLQEIVARLRAKGADAIAVECDVADRNQVERVANEAISHFGRIDTWINNAGLGLYGRLEEVNPADAHRLFEINFWGVVYGSLVALPHLRTQGGALINVGSEVSEAATPLLGIYVASKHAVKGFTDSLRIEVQELDKSPISITLIEPTAVNTPFPQHARNYMEKEAKLPEPMLDPQKVADAILDAAVHSTRTKRVGAKATLSAVLSNLSPAIADRMAAKQADQLHRDEPTHHAEGALFRSSEAMHSAGHRHPVLTNGH